MRRQRVVPALAALAWLLFAPAQFSPSATADTVHLKDGRRIEGAIKRTPDGWQITATDGTVTTVAPSQVIKVELTGDASAGADDKLNSLLRALEAETNLEQIIARLERFAATYTGTAAADRAAGEAALYRERRDKGMRRVGARWLTPDQFAELLTTLDRQADQAARLVAEGRWRDAEPAIDEILAIDPRNIAALYLQGLVLYSQDKLIPARKAFEAVNAQIADHAPTLNNLAVIAFRQNQPGPSLSYYEQAIAAQPLARPILDNVAEALHAVSLDDAGRRMPILKRLERAFLQQDQALAAQLAKQDLYRWGAAWVDRPTLERLLSEERRIAERISKLESERRERQGEVGVIEDQIVATEQALRRMEADRYVYASDGTLLAMPLPPAYHQMQRDLQVLRGNRLRAIADIQRVDADIRAARQELPVPRFTGVQKLIGPEGTPLEHPPAAAAPEQTPATAVREPAPPPATAPTPNPRPNG